MESALNQRNKDVARLKRQIRRLIKESWNYTDHENCVFCEGDRGKGFVNDGRHHPDCELKKAQTLLKEIP